MSVWTLMAGSSFGTARMLHAIELESQSHSISSEALRMRTLMIAVK